MKRFFSAMILGAAVAAANAGDIVLRDVAVDTLPDALRVSLTVDATALKLKGNEEVRVTPLITFADGHSLPFETLVYAGHNRRIRLERNPYMLDGGKLTEAKAVPVSADFPREAWMTQAGDVRVDVLCKGCCNRVSREYGLTQPFDLTPEVPFVFSPAFVFAVPEVEGTKMRDLSGKAFVDFRVNRTEIDPTYRQNPRELQAIHATIDSVNNDADVTIKGVTFTGYASPEGSYANNTRLAEGRTAALSEYVRKLYNFDKRTITTKSVPEDWDGLRAAVAAGDLPARDALLAVIDDTALSPDARDRKLARSFPREYAYLLSTVYPALRHCDYTIAYEVKQYDDPKQILALVETAPHKLSLREFFVAANTLQPGTPQYNKVFETAARMFPTSDVANLNVAIVRLQNGDLRGAQEFLDKAGNTPLAVYTRGVAKAMAGDYDAARTLFRQAATPEANAAIRQLDDAGM